MTKDMLITKIAEKTEVTKKDARAVIEAFAEVVMETLREDKDEKITLAPLGSFKVKDVPERSGKVMMGDKKGEIWTTPAHSEICFKMSKSAKIL